jgi:hypothetical protein
VRRLSAYLLTPFFRIMLPFLRDRRFWLAAIAMAAGCAFVYGWMAGAFAPLLRGPLRPPITRGELIFTLLMIGLLSVDAGLYAYRRARGSCPTGTGKATGLAGILGGLVLVCPACTFIPIAFLGTGFTLAILTPYLPLLRAIAVVLAGACLLMLWPKKQ